MTTVTHRKPRRIQRRRSKGWRMPATARFVGRGTRFGNGWKIGEPHPDHGGPITRRDAVDLYAASLAGAKPESLAIIRRELGGRDLACWCRPDQECHADLLLIVANEAPQAGDPIEGMHTHGADEPCVRTCPRWEARP